MILFQWPVLEHLSIFLCSRAVLQPWDLNISEITNQLQFVMPVKPRKYCGQKSNFEGAVGGGVDCVDGGHCLWRSSY